MTDKPFTALLLDKSDVLVEVVTLTDEDQLTDRHVDFRPHGNACDRNPGEYRWNAPLKCLEPLPSFKRMPAKGVPCLEQVVYTFITGGVTAPLVKAWLEHYEENGGKKLPNRRN